MDDDRKGQPGGSRPANDNTPETGETEGGGDRAPSLKVDRLVLDIARLIGRQMARDDFERLRTSAANDNDKPREAGDGDGGATED